jgi:cellobiose phosphorylase
MIATDEQAHGVLPPGDEPMRGDLFGADRLAESARILAASQRWSGSPLLGSSPVQALVDRAASELSEFYGTFAADARDDIPLSPAAEWLVDNFYLIEEQVRAVRADLPRDYRSELPHLTAGPLSGYPRVFESVAALIVHTDARIDSEHLSRYVSAFQDVSPFTIGEVWAVPIMLRVCLIENLRRLGGHVLSVHQAGIAGDRWVDRVLRAVQDGGDVRSLVDELDRAHEGAPSQFLVRLAQRLQGQDGALEPLLEWLEKTLATRKISVEQLVTTAHQEQAADQVSVANAITSIRFLGSLEWREFFEESSFVEQILREDPAGVYHRMDFVSRDRYRHAVEALARRSALGEIGVAEAVISHAFEALGRDPSDQVGGHVGHYLISDGRYALERSVGYRARIRERVYRGPLASRGHIYWGLLGTSTIGLVVALGAYVRSQGAESWQVALIVALALIPLSDIALVVTNRLAAWLWPARMLPKVDYTRPIAEAHRSLVVYTALMTSPGSARRVLDNLEVGYLANSDPNVRFAILADLKGGPAEHDKTDAHIIDAARHGIATLNARYGASETDGPFHLFVRGRRYNERERSWMGWERKRGALLELAKLLRGATETSFSVVVGDSAALASVTFVITLDTDTVLPRDGARKLVSTIAHPLNRARFDGDRQIVTRGHGLIQPRVGMSLTGAHRSGFAWLHSGVTGIDPYAGAVSDTYQDVFGEGSFTGKGIFEVDVFNAALDGRLPTDTLLSHDLLEGSYLRTGLASDVEVLDDQPSSYIAHCARLHRWVRGDWQTLPWLLPVVPTQAGSEVNPLRALHRWKIGDNLRRSLVAPSMLAMAATGWAILPGADWAWLGVILAVLLFPVYFSFLDSLVFRAAGAALRGDPISLFEDLKRDSVRGLLSAITLPHQAYLMSDAIVRALWRMTISRRKLLEWETADEVERRLGSTSLADFWRRMWPGVVLALAAVVPALLCDEQPLPSLLAALPVVIAWSLAPVAAWRASLPWPPKVLAVTPDEAETMRRIARRTWRFFETFVTAEDHWLAPDNYQEDPKGEVAHRTSPTNIGLQMLAALSAYDFGYLSPSGLVQHVSRTLQTMAGLERFRGHFFNWYDTLTLLPLRPGYVSTVDSGNLAGHLLVVRVGLLEASERPLVGPEVLSGLADTVRLALEDVIVDRDALESETTSELRTTLQELLRRLRLEDPPSSLGSWWVTLQAISGSARALPALASSLAPRGPRGAGALERVRRSVADVSATIAGRVADIEHFAPWSELLASLPNGVADGPHRETLAPLLSNVPSLVGLAEGLDGVLGALDALGLEPETAEWASALAAGIRGRRQTCVHLLAEARLAADMAREMWESTDFEMLYDRSRKVFSIGFNTAEGRLDSSFYDMLASECRLASYLAIAKGDVPQEHWFRLGRSITQTTGGRALVSWSASMFEYLMPLLIMRSYPDTLLDQTYRSVVARQIDYGNQRGVPWGVSESAFNAKDVELTYQYQAFGVPGLGLKRGLSEDVVIAPYATALAAMVDPAAAMANLAALAKHGAEGRYGFYEAVDYTPGRVPAGKERAVVKTYMAHHQGMSLIAIGNVMTDFRMQKRFDVDPLVASAGLLLQERVPRRLELAHPRVEEVEFIRSVRETPPPVARSYPTASTAVPATHFLSNGSYSVMVTNAGGGYSRWRDREVTRYREDITRDCWGTFIYLRDVADGRVWSATLQPTLTEPDEYHVTFSADKAEFRRTDAGIETHTEVHVSPEDDAEVRRVTVTNHRREPISIEVTSYFEVTMAPRGADGAHKSFSNLFVETSLLPEAEALLFTRRPRSAEEPRCWGMHVLACELAERCAPTFETDRAGFLGRHRTPLLPQAVTGGGSLSGTVGAVLDPACAIRRMLTIGPGETARMAFATGAAESREEIVALAEKYRDIRSAQRAADMAWSTSQIELRDLGITPEEAVTFQRLASRLLLTDSYSRLKVHTEIENRLGVAGLWQIGISGDHPIMLVKVERIEETPLVRQALLAHQYWRSKGFVADLVILNTKPSAYSSQLDGKLRMLLRTGHALQLVDRPGGVHLRASDHMAPDVRNLLASAARVTLTGDGGPLGLQLNRRATYPEAPDTFVPTREPDVYPASKTERPALAFDNGVGGFDLESDEYVIVLEGEETTPLPWVNVFAGPRFGGLVSEAGIGCTWAENSHENRITTWNNDIVSDGTGECLYIRDEETGEFWSPTPLPVRSPEPYVIRHGRGYSRFEHESHGLRHEVDWFVAANDMVRFARLRLTNASDRERQLSVTHHIEWVLGSSRSAAQQRVVTWWDEKARTLMAHSWFNMDFPGAPAFLACDCDLDGYTASRTEFIGRNGTPADPAAMYRRGLAGITGRFHDNCGALQKLLTIAPGETKEITFLLGQADTVERAHAVVEWYRKPGAVQSALDEVRGEWRSILGTVQAETPDAALDTLVNGSLLYQTLACRFWGRTATYQSSGAYGFRDQLQDCLALLFSRPELVREHIIEAARRQFPEGDVLHWWQPVTGRGVRTHFSDDRHWLPYVVAEYIRVTGDTSVLDVETAFLEAPPVPDGREDFYVQPNTSLVTASVYDHCLAALDAAPLGERGLPLMGGGDWNDGMNRVGIGGKGESVWLAWFLDVAFRAFAQVAEGRGEQSRADELRRRADELVAAIEATSWDGSWYRRAYFDDGTPLGSKYSPECRIDAIAQAWSVISGKGEPERARRAMESVEEQLVRWDDGLVKLLAPPFDKMPGDPGYIKGYVPGVRENGGQYTHAALWVALAYALMGDGDEAVSLLDLINPINHSLDAEGVARYRVEPYVVAADIYAIEPHVGRGGWTWYTGSSAWFYRVIVRYILGIDVAAAERHQYLSIDPCVPKAWTSFRITYRFGGTTYRIRVENPRGVNRGVAEVELDGKFLDSGRVRLADDGAEHEVVVRMLGA